MDLKSRALKRILVGTDFSIPATEAVERAALLAAEHSAELEIVHVTPDGVFERYLQEAVALARSHGAHATGKAIRGSCAPMLAIEAQDFAANLVVVGARGGRSFADVVRGTTTERLMKLWKGDTLIVKANPRSPYERILACVALAPVSHSVLVSAIALSAHARLHLLHAYESLLQRMYLIHRIEPTSVEMDRLATVWEARQRVAELLRQCAVPPGRHLETILWCGWPADTILSTAVRLNADVVVLGRNRSSLEELLLGSVTKQVMRAASSDVLVSHSAPSRSSGPGLREHS